MADLEELSSVIRGRRQLPRQRLLYLHVREPSVRSEVIGWAEHPGEEPGGESRERPYPSVLAATRQAHPTQLSETASPGAAGPAAASALSPDRRLR